MAHFAALPDDTLIQIAARLRASERHALAASHRALAATFASDNDSFHADLLRARFAAYRPPPALTPAAAVAYCDTADDYFLHSSVPHIPLLLPRLAAAGAAAPASASSSSTRHNHDSHDNFNNSNNNNNNGGGNRRQRSGSSQLNGYATVAPAAPRHPIAPLIAVDDGRDDPTAPHVRTPRLHLAHGTAYSAFVPARASAASGYRRRIRRATSDGDDNSNESSDDDDDDGEMGRHRAAPVSVGSPAAGALDGDAACMSARAGAVAVGLTNGVVSVRGPHHGAGGGWKRMRGHAGRVCSVSLFADGCAIASGAADRTVRVRRITGASGGTAGGGSSNSGIGGGSGAAVAPYASSAQPASCVLRGHDGPVTWVAAMAERGRGMLASSGGGTGRVKLWDVEKAACVSTARLPGPVAAAGTAAGVTYAAVGGAVHALDARVGYGETVGILTLPPQWRPNRYRHSSRARSSNGYSGSSSLGSSSSTSSSSYSIGALWIGHDGTVAAAVGGGGVALWPACGPLEATALGWAARWSSSSSTTNTSSSSHSHAHARVHSSGSRGRGSNGSVHANHAYDSNVDAKRALRAVCVDGRRIVAGGGAREVLVFSRDGRVESVVADDGVARAAVVDLASWDDGALVVARADGRVEVVDARRGTVDWESVRRAAESEGADADERRERRRNGFWVDGSSVPFSV